MSQTLGEKLRLAREQHGISISEVAENTRISPHYIKSIENDDYKPLPGGIFNKGFIKSYARFVGIDENEALQDYADIIAQHQEEPVEEAQRSYRPEVLTDERYSESRAPTIIFAGIILALMTAGILFGVRFLQNRNEQPAANAATAAANSGSTTNVPLAATSPVAQPASDRLSIQLRAEGSSVWISYTADGASKIQTLAQNESVTIEPANTFSISYSRAKVNNLKVAVNGKELAPPQDSSKGSIQFAINRSNVADILQSGQLGSGRPTATATPKQTPKPTPKASVSPKPVTSSKPPTVPPAANANHH